MVRRVPVFLGHVDDHAVLHMSAAEQSLRRDHLRTLLGQDVEVVVRKKRSKRSADQNAWHWAVAVPMIAAELGYEPHEKDDVHYALVAKCFGTRFDERVKQEIPNARSSELTTEQFSELMEWEVRWAAKELGIVVPLPSESEEG